MYSAASTGGLPSPVARNMQDALGVHDLLLTIPGHGTIVQKGLWESPYRGLMVSRRLSRVSRDGYCSIMCLRFPSPCYHC